jgi:hypothetical protein
VDLLGDIWQKSGDEEYSYQERNLEAQRRNAQALLLGRLYSSLKASPRDFQVIAISFGSMEEKPFDLIRKAVEEASIIQLPQPRL